MCELRRTGEILLLLRTRQVTMAGEPPDDASFDMSIYDSDERRTGPAVPSIESGEFIAKYEVRKPLGKGAFGAVYLCHDLYADRDVAVKVFLTAQGVERSMIAGGRFEARANAKVRHPQIAGLLDHGHLLEQKIDYLVFEFIEGQTLEAELKQAGQFSLRKTILVMQSICEPLKKIHQAGLTHRDLKPANIVLNNEGQAHILDFGIALLEENQSLLPPHVAGTQPFMAPEQLSGQISQVDGRADIWAMGVIMYQLLTGELPFKSKAAILSGQFRPPSMRQPKLALYLDEVCTKCLSVSQKDRFQSAASLDESLSRIALSTTASIIRSPELPASALPTPAANISDKFAYHGRLAAVSVVVLLLVAILALQLFKLNNKDGMPEPDQSLLSVPAEKERLPNIASVTKQIPRTSGSVPAPATVATSTDDRAVAKWVHDLGGLISVDLSSGENWVEYPAGSTLPYEDFSVVEIDLSPVHGINNSHLRYLADKNLPRLATLDLEATDISDEGLRHITKFRELADIELNDIPLTDNCVKHLIQVNKLVFLYLADTEITDVGIEQLARVRLKRLDLENLQGVTDASAEVLSRIRSLRSQRGLVLEGTSITPSAIQKYGLDEYIE